MVRGFFLGDRMNTEGKLGSLRSSSIVVTVFALLLVSAGLVQIGLGGLAVSKEYELIENVDQMTRQSATF